MMKKLRILVLLMWSKIKIIANLVAENIVLRQQLAVMKRTNKRPKFRMTDRLFWVLLSRIWHSWRESLVIVKPDTVVRWHRKGFKLFWTFKSKGAGRPRIGHEIRKLVRKMAKANPSLRCAQDSRGIAPAGIRCLRTNRIKSHAPVSTECKTVSDVADFPEQSCRQVFDRFFHCPDSRFQHFVRSGDPLPLPPQSRIFQCNVKPDGPVDNPAGRGGLPLGYGAKVFDAGSGFDLWCFLS